MKALENITINQKYGLVLKEDIDKQNELIKRLQEQINNANMVINKCLTLTNDYDKKCFLEGYKIMWGVK